jgi:hypothetical protein
LSSVASTCPPICPRICPRPQRTGSHPSSRREGVDGHHLIDGEVSAVEPNTITLIGRGRCTSSRRRSGYELMHTDPTARANPKWLLAGPRVRTTAVAAGDVPRLA